MRVLGLTARKGPGIKGRKTGNADVDGSLASRCNVSVQTAFEAILEHELEREGERTMAMFGHRLQALFGWATEPFGHGLEAIFGWAKLLQIPLIDN